MSKGAAAWGAFDRVLDACAWIACAMLLFQVVSVSADVLLRYFWDVSYSWITALNEWSLVYIAFLGAGWLEREAGHTRDESIVKFFGSGAERLAERLGQLLGIAICLLLVWFGSQVTWDKYEKSVYDFFKLQAVPVFWIYLAIPVGSMLWLVQLLRQLSGRRSTVAQPLPPEF